MEFNWVVGPVPSEEFRLSWQLFIIDAFQTKISPRLKNLVFGTRGGGGRGSLFNDKRLKFLVGLEHVRIVEFIVLLRLFWDSQNYPRLIVPRFFHYTFNPTSSFAMN